MTITDTFNRADSTTSLGTTSDGTATWVAGRGTWGITSNTAKMFDSLATADQAYIDCSNQNGTVQLTLATLDTGTGNRFGGPMFRWTDTSNYWFVRCKQGSGNSQIVRVSGGSKLQLGSTFTTVATDVITVVLAATSIVVKQNGTVVSNILDSFNQSATKHGMYSETQVTHFDDWSFVPGTASLGWVVGAITLN